MRGFDAIVVGGGPAGSSAATYLVKAGLRVAVIDRETFPRVKLCAGWISTPIWDELGLRPEAYPHGLWTWDRCYVSYRGQARAVAGRGYFIRRVELDAFLLERSGAEVIRHAVKQIVRDGDDWVIDGAYKARFLVGAGGTHCPVARLLAPRRTERAVGVQELEFECSEPAVAATRLGQDGEPELLLHDDFGGYSWNVPKASWLNVGCGTMEARQVRGAWREAREYFAPHMPADASARLEDAKGHSYYLFDPAHLERCAENGAFLVGDSLGLAQPITAEGILPAVLSGRLAAQTIIAAGTPDAYRHALAHHPVLADYDAYYRLRMAGSRLKDRAEKRPRARRWSVPVSMPAVVDRQLAKMTNAAIAHGFGWMFAGKPLPARRALTMLLGGPK